MAQIGSLTTGAGIQTVIAGQSQCEEYLLIGDVDTANPLQAIQVEIDGTPFITINTAALITAYMKWLMQTAGAAVGLLLKVATGMIKKNTTYRLTNSGATTPAIFAFSDSKNGVPFIATSKQINPSAYEDFEKFSALFITAPANVSSLEMSFSDGHRATMTAAEAAAMFALRFESETDGYLGGVLCIDNTNQNIVSVRAFCVTTALTVLVVKLPNEAFKILNS
jgi:hypothetical protein